MSLMKMKLNKIVLIVGCLLLAGVQPMLAQDGYNPPNPVDPQYQERVTVKATADPTEGGNVSVALASTAAGNIAYGNDKYLLGTKLSIRTSAKPYHKFLKWTLNGVDYSTSTSLTYTVGAEAANFVAHYEYVPYNPSNPGDPQEYNKYRLFLVTDPDNACAFNLDSGAKQEGESRITVTAYPGSYYKFLGWYKDGQKLSSSTSFNYQMPSEDTTLEARVEYIPYNPDSPADPFGNQQNVSMSDSNPGDVNNDGKIDILDVVQAVNIYLSNKTEGVDMVACDVNSDGKVDILDVVVMVNWYLQGKSY